MTLRPYNATYVPAAFRRFLEGLLEACAHVPVAFSQPDASIDSARVGWNHTFKRYMQKELSADLQRGEKELAQALTLDRFERFSALVSFKNRNGGN